MRTISFILSLMGTLAAGCASQGTADEDAKSMVMTRYDQFAKSGGKACDE